MAVAAPGPVFGVLYEAASDGIAVDVAELLDDLGLGEHVEVVVAGLPELWTIAFELTCRLGFEDAESVFELLVFWLAEEQVHVLGHKDVAEKIEAVTSAGFFEDVEEDGAGSIVVEEGKASVATEGDEVVVTEGVVSLEAARHAVDGQGHTPLIAMIPR